MLTIQDVEHEINQALIKMDGPNAASTILLSRHEALAVIHYLHENMNLRAERVQLQGENESLRADLLATKRTVDTLLDDVKAEIDTLLDDVKAENPTARDKTDIEVLAERLAKVEDRLAAIASEIVDQHKDIDRLEDGIHERIDGVTEIIGRRIAELVEKTGGTIPGYPLTDVLSAAGGKIERPPLTPEQRDTFGRGDEVRLDMAQTQGGRRIFGWYVVEAIRTDISGYTVQVSAPEKADPKPLFWIKPEDVLEVRKPTR